MTGSVSKHHGAEAHKDLEVNSLCHKSRYELQGEYSASHSS
jgi:hypothetical protein